MNIEQVRQLEMERFSMNKAAATDKAAASRMKALDKQLKELKAQQGVRTLPIGPHDACFWAVTPASFG